MSLIARLLPLVLVLGLSGCDPTPSGGGARGDEIVLGTHLEDTPFPSAFVPLSDGDTLPVVKGSQGAWMVVACVRTDAFEHTSKVTIRGDLIDVETGTEMARLKFRKALVRPGDGYSYAADLYLILAKPGGEAPPLDWDGRDAVLRLRLDDLQGWQLEDSITVHLVGAPPS